MDASGCIISICSTIAFHMGLALCYICGMLGLQGFNSMALDQSHSWERLKHEQPRAILIWQRAASFSEKAMVPHSSILAWKIPWMEEPGRLQCMESLGVGHDWATSLSLFTFVHWRRKWQPTPVFLPGESQGRGSLVGCRLWGCTESDTTEAT